VYFHPFTIISPCRGVNPFFWTKLNPLPPRLSVPSLVKIGLVVLEKMIFKWPTPFLHFCDYLPLKEDLALYLNKLEFPSPKDNLYQVWLNLASWFWRRRFSKVFQCIFTLPSLSPLGEGRSPSFVQTWIPFTKGWFVPSLVKTGPVVLE
jgi:hypothetical protein